MPRYKDEPTVVRVYTVCDESRYLIAKNVPALGCGDELLKLFASYGDVEEIKPMDAEDCEFAKRKLDEFGFLGNRLQIFYAPQFETLSDTQDKLEGRRKEVLARLNPGRSNGPRVPNPGSSSETLSRAPAHHLDSNQFGSSFVSSNHKSQTNDPPITRVSSDQEYFPSNSMNRTVKLVREKLNKIESSAEHLQAVPVSKKPRVDNRRRI